MHAPTLETTLEHDLERARSSLNKLVSRLGYEIVDIAGFLDAVHHTADDQLDTLANAQDGLDALNGSSAAVVVAANQVSNSSRNALEAVEGSMGTMRASTEKSQTVSGWVATCSDRITGMEDSLNSVLHANTEINRIAKQVNILAINASIEAVRAGDAGRGFAVVANAVKQLSLNTSQAARDVAVQISQLTETVQTLKAEAIDASQEAQVVLANSSETDAALAEIAATIRQTTSDTSRIVEQSSQVEAASQRFAPAFDKLSSLTRKTAQGVTQASDRATALIDRSEAIVQHTASLGGRSVDTPFIAYVQDAADRIRDRWESAVASGDISIEALFDTKYTAIPGSNPTQVMSRATTFTDTSLPPIQEAALGFDPKVVFCAAIDQNGYLPTHNKKFSHPPSDDPVWNASHCRNRRIFDDRVGLKSGKSTAPFLLQVYRRDMGGGTFVMMKDLSAPIFVNGQHWGGLRMAYKFD